MSPKALLLAVLVRSLFMIVSSVSVVKRINRVTSTRSDLVTAAQHVFSLPPVAPPGNAVPSNGCIHGRRTAMRGASGGSPSVDSTGKLVEWRTTTHTIDVSEKFLSEDTPRQYELSVPDNPMQSLPAPLIFFFHGQYGRGSEQYWMTDVSDGANLVSFARKSGFVQVFPQGLDDYMGSLSDLGSGWNVGSGGDNSTCQIGSATEHSCYESCRELNQCGKCNWATCHDDMAFVQALLKKLSGEQCVDLSRVYALGESNGAMFIQRLSETMPHTFAAVVSLYGLPLRSYLPGRNIANGEGTALQRLELPALLALHDRYDAIIPVNGSMAPAEGQGWFYESLSDLVGAWATTNGCKEKRSMKVDVPNNIECVDNQGCGGNTRVVGCVYGSPEMSHGDMPSDSLGSKMSFWFLNQFRLP